MNNDGRERSEEGAVIGEAMIPGETSVLEWLERVEGEYREMPGLSLTEQQAQRLWGLDSTACRVLFDTLLERGFLRRSPRGGYVRADIR
jgi:hypothetical protein